MEQTTAEKPQKTGLLAWLRKRVAAIGGLLIALAIIIAVGCVYLRYPDFFKNLQDYDYSNKGALLGYGATFIISIVLNATVIIPVSNVAFIFSFGGSLPLPYLVGLAGGLGASIGEMTGYLAGRSGRGLLARSKVYNRMELWVKKWGWLAVFILSIVPFVFDVVGLIAGALRMPAWRFFIACWLGRTVSYVTVAYLGAWGFEKALQWFG